MMTIPRARLVYDELSTRLSPALESIPMKRQRRASYPVWRSERGEDGAAIFLSLQVDTKATDPFAGGGFRIELENTGHRAPARGLKGRAMFYQLMTAAELQALLVLQNRIIRLRPKPPREQVELYPEGPVRQQYLKYFAPQSTFDVVNTWLRYGSVPDLREWGDLLAPYVPPLVERAKVYLNPERLTLGRGRLLPEP